MTVGHLSIDFAPLLPWWLIASLGGVALLMLALAIWRGARGAGWRAAAILLLLAGLANPSLVEEQRRLIEDVAVLAIDQSSSQRVTPRPDQLAAAAPEIERRLREIPGMELRVVRVEPRREEGDDGTALFGPVTQALADVPASRIAGIVLLSDGQIHDLPLDLAKLGFEAPVHLLLTGLPDEGDRRLSVPTVPSFGLVGQPVQMTIRVEDLDAPPEAEGSQPRQTQVTVLRDGEPQPPVTVPIGEEVPLELELDHAGQTLFEVEVEVGPRELTLANNRAFITINGVRDRLRVLLVSGEPHPGERTWRNLLKADPGVDLVHFTILRPPEKQDGTPIGELSLIAFPIRELFEVKLEEFDLIIFDRYQRRGVLPRTYLENIAHFVEDGGALLDAAGSSYAGAYTLYNSPLQRIFPAAPTGDVLQGSFKPTISEIGRRHPVTAGLPGGSSEPPSWGRWFRQVGANVMQGSAVMTGIEGQPLLVLNRIGKGRVAQLLSDEIWLWSRGYQGGGPQAELLRRVAHWLMKEPELEEEDLRAVIAEGKLSITRRSLGDQPKTVEVTLPSGRSIAVPLSDQGDGRAVAETLAEENGLYKVSDGERTAFAAAGALNSKEYADLRSTDALAKPLVEASGGGIIRLADNDLPQVRRVRPGRDAAGSDWIGLRSNEDYVVTGVDATPLLPVWLLLILLLGTTLLGWRSEGH